ncbi:hypothetical protein PoB_002895000 [Plakobranchus ocellatus]|uniref:Uncharacterized protein n=1 Tax=Plakobranchus ocellatus TaxID=259542 RepID=A0AAV4A6L4_9GAST|nr:hypothetical protein PoB_002895000 [Plakobranchus ocellatus]
MLEICLVSSYAVYGPVRYFVVSLFICSSRTNRSQDSGPPLNQAVGTGQKFNPAIEAGSLSVCHHRLKDYRNITKPGVGNTVGSESTLRPAGTFMWRIRVQPPKLWPDGWREKQRLPCCGLTI